MKKVYPLNPACNLIPVILQAKIRLVCSLKNGRLSYNLKQYFINED